MTSRLKTGDLIGIAAPASPFEKSVFEAGVRALKKMGFETRFREDLFDRNGYLAGSDERRLTELIELLKDDEIKAIFFARGGYGSQRVLSLLPKKMRTKGTPKPLIGFSDLTPLLTYFRQKWDYPTFYGPSITTLGNHPSERTLTALEQILKEGRLMEPILLSRSHILKEGTIKGKLVGGCLALIATSIGTPYQLKTEGSILFLEDTNEKLYSLDRMLTQLKNAGLFKGVKGILFGTCLPTDANAEALDRMLLDLLGDLKVPIVTNIPTGHTSDFVTLPLGAVAHVDTKKGVLSFEPTH